MRLGLEEEEEECGDEREGECSGFEGLEKREGHSIIPCEEFASRPFVKSLSLALSVFLTDQCVCDNFRPFCPHFHSAFQSFFSFSFFIFFSFVKRKFH